MYVFISSLSGIVLLNVLQTFLGGLQVMRNDIPWWIIVPQVIIFLFPALLSIPFTILLEYSTDSSTAR